MIKAYGYWIVLLLFWVSIPPSLEAQIIKGKIDLRGYDFTQNIKLDGEWEFYWNELVYPKGDKQVPDYLYFPSLWNGSIVGEDTLSSFGYSSYRLILELPPNPADYAFFIEDFYCAFQMYVDGVPLASNGRVGADKDNYTPEWRPLVVDLPGASGNVEVILHVANFDHSKGGTSQSMTFGLKVPVHKQYDTLWDLSVVLTSVLILTAILFLIRFGFISLDMASFYFALFCLSYSYRVIGADLYVLHSMLPDYPWLLGIKLEYITLFLSPFFFGKYIETMYPGEVSRWAIRSLGVICFAFIGITILGSPYFFSQLITPFFIILMGYFFYAFMVFISAYLNKRNGAIYGVISASIAFAVFTYLIFVYFRILPQSIYSPFVAYMLFMIFQSLQLYTYSKGQNFMKDSEF